MLVMGSIFPRDEGPSTFFGLPEVAARCDKGFVFPSPVFTVTISLRFLNRNRTQPFLLPPVAVLDCLALQVSVFVFGSLLLLFE